MKKPDVRIYMVYHKASPMIGRAPFVPIQVGKGEPIPGIEVRDNTGDNIAAKNANYCELTAQYWIWKNVRADYVGLAHYRRIPSFTAEYAETFEDFSDETCRRFGWDETTISGLLKEFDVLLPPCWPTFPPGEPGHIMTPYEFHCIEHRASDMDETLRVIKELTPEMWPYAEQALLKDTNECFGNVCIMRKDLFDSYSEWLFKVLFELERRIEIPKEREHARVFGFLSERLIMVWLAYARDRLGIKEWYSAALPLMEGKEDLRPSAVSASPMDRVSDPVLSVVIPVYNVAPYLCKCLNSVCGQCLEDIEIICVDDGSTDGSFEILERFAAVDKRIVLVKGDHAGPGAARNKGLDVARGKYLGFVDSDDWVDRFIWWRTVHKAERLNLQMVLFESLQVDDETGKKWYNPWARLRLPNKCYADAFTWRDVGRNPLHTCCYPLNRIVRRDFWGSRRFPDLLIGEDAVLHNELMLKAERIGAFECPFYFYRQRAESLMAKRKKYVLDHLAVADLTRKACGITEQDVEQWTNYVDYVYHLLRVAYEWDPTRSTYSAMRKWVLASPIGSAGDDKSRWVAAKFAHSNYIAFRLSSLFDVFSPDGRGAGKSFIKAVRGFVKLFVPYAIMKRWLLRRYKINLPPLPFGKFRSAINGCLPFGWVVAVHGGMEHL